jgi:hypothetical protein
MIYKEIQKKKRSVDPEKFNMRIVEDRHNEARINRKDKDVYA